MSGWVVLRLKEVAPQKIPQKCSSFWTHDIKAHREYERTVVEKNRTLLDEARKALDIQKTDDTTLEESFVHTIYEKIEQDKDYINIKEWATRIPKISSSGLKPIIEIPEIKIDLITSPEDAAYLRYERSQSTIHGTLDNRLRNQANRLIRRSMRSISSRNNIESGDGFKRKQENRSSSLVD